MSATGSADKTTPYVWWVVLALAVVVLGTAAGLLFSGVGDNVDVRAELARFCLTLTSALLITGGLSAHLTRRAARRSREEERARGLTASLRELKAAFETVQVVRLHLQAHPTPSTFMERLGEIIAARAHLHLVERDVHLLRSPVREHVQTMLDYLDGLRDFYRSSYGRLRHDAAVERGAWARLEGGGEEEVCPTPLADYGSEVVTAFLSDEAFRAGAFSTGYQAASTEIYRALGVERPAPQQA
ncbi:hypothetical protein GCM10023340_10370 [Nocardioides marinquilinus]|uniref:Uncharacterized protein n=1 Tax=Nocardioides marinquilinus TaxID=1210400 RepID=A0ABP9PHU9_9ACTN